MPAGALTSLAAVMRRTQRALVRTNPAATRALAIPPMLRHLPLSGADVLLDLAPMLLLFGLLEDIRIAGHLHADPAAALAFVTLFTLHSRRLLSADTDQFVSQFVFCTY